MNRMLFIVIGSLEVGGAEKHLSYVLPSLVKKGWTVHVISLSDKVPLKPVFEEEGICVHVLCSTIPGKGTLFKTVTKLLQTSFRLFCLYKRYPCQVFHFFLPASYMIGMLVAFMARHKGPRIMSRRSMNLYQRRRPLLGHLEKCLHSYTTYILANSKRVWKDLVTEGVSANRLGLIYNGVAQPVVLKAPESCLTLMCVANLIPYKGHRDLLMALAQIKDLMPLRWRLWIVGKDSAHILPELKDLTVQLNLASHVDFLDSQKDVASLWARCHIGVLCSHEEGFSNAILEAMAQSIPMVVTDVGGNAEAVIDGITGYVVPAHDPCALGKALLDLVQEEGRRTEMGAAAYQRYQDHFTLEKCVESYHQMYLNILSKESSVCVE